MVEFGADEVVDPRFQASFLDERTVGVKVCKSVVVHAGMERFDESLERRKLFLRGHERRALGGAVENVRQLGLATGGSGQIVGGFGEAAIIVGLGGVAKEGMSEDMSRCVVYNFGAKLLRAAFWAAECSFSFVLFQPR